MQLHQDERFSNFSSAVHDKPILTILIRSESFTTTSSSISKRTSVSSAACTCCSTKSTARPCPSCTCAR